MLLSIIMGVVMQQSSGSGKKCQARSMSSEWGALLLGHVLDLVPKSYRSHRCTTVEPLRKS